MVSKGGYKRRSTVGMVPVSFSRIEKLILAVEKQNYGYSIKGGLSREDQVARNQALIVLLYYSARRISELVGRTLKLEDGGLDVWDGVKVKDFRYDTMNKRDVLVMKVRILKKGRAKKESIRTVFREVAMDITWPRMQLLIDWLEHQRGYGSETKMFKLNRSRAFQILKALDKDVFNHWLRHQRFSHLGDHLTPYQLNERLGFWESINPSISYVHGRVGAYLEAADKTVS